MDSYYQDHQGNGIGEGSRTERLSDAPTWVWNDRFWEEPSTGYSQQETIPTSTHWSDYQEDSYVACNPCPTEFSSNYGEQEQKSFEATVMQRLDAIQAKIDKRALENEEVSLRTRVSIQTDVMLMEANLRNRFEEHFHAFEESIVLRFEQYLDAHEERIIRRLEEHSSKTTQMYEKLLHKKVKDLHSDLEAVKCWMVRVENRMENEMGQLYCGMFKAQGRFDESDSDDENACCPHLVEELLNYNVESIQKDPRYESVEKGCESIPSMSNAYTENERLLCDDIASLRNDCLSNEAVQKHSMNIDDMREWDYTACPPVENRDHSIGAELPSLQEESSLSPTIRTCYSCELACAPQVQACFGALAFNSSMAKSHEEPSWKEENLMVDFEEQQMMRKRKRRVTAQVWIPKGTLEVMRIFHMTALNLGTTSCVLHRAKKRKRRRKSSNPPGGVG